LSGRSCVKPDDEGRCGDGAEEDVAALVVAGCHCPVVLLRSDALALLRRVSTRMSSGIGTVLWALLADVEDDPERVREIRDQLGCAGVGPWLTAAPGPPPAARSARPR